jgi:hypothetical protein
VRTWADTQRGSSCTTAPRHARSACRSSASEVRVGRCSRADIGVGAVCPDVRRRTRLHDRAGLCEP